MTYSLNEVEAMAKRAARGGGYDWGLAEEAAKAVRWLEARGLGGVRVLADLLREMPDGAECPITRGAALSDRAVALWDGAYAVGHVTHAALILPFASMASSRLSAPLRVDINDTAVLVDAQNVELTAGLATEKAPVTCAISDRPPSPCQIQTRATPDPKDWATLTQIAHRTYAPATEESRLLGAGAGLLDDD